ncbi:MAG: hypothetical protein ACK4NU_06040 [Brevundimonas sp.]
MRRDEQKKKGAPDRDPKTGKSGWRAFVLGMIGMFALIALWIVLVETADDPHGEVEFIGRPQAAEKRALEPRDAWADRPISDHR